MTILDPLRRHWREALLMLAVALPWFSLLVLGLIWLWQGGHVLVWAAAAAALGLLAWPLREAVRRRAKQESRLVLGDLAEPSRNWNATEREAWTKVLTIADAAAPLSFLQWEPMLAITKQTVEIVAHQFHSDATEPWARFTIPEALLLTERVARDIRREALRHIPGVGVVRFSKLLWAQRLNDQYGSAARKLWPVARDSWRFVRVILNPANAVAQEAKDLILNQTGGVLSYRVRAYATRLLVLEVGRAAVDLYSGRLKLSEEELQAAREHDHAAADGQAAAPVRILLAGQINAGKSSLLNAMAKEVRCAAGPLPTTAGDIEHMLDVDGRPAVILVDTPGLIGGEREAEILAQKAERADLILWVTSATQPARATDREALNALRSSAGRQLDRRPPPILAVLTQVDHLRPAAEWTPPYDVTNPAGTKACAIRAAMDAIARALDLPVDAVVPVALRPGAEPYNIDALWARLALDLDEARLAQLDRLRIEHEGIDLRNVAEQFLRLGRWVGKAVVSSKLQDGL